jgi:hypothetical protein
MKLMAVTSPASSVSSSSKSFPKSCFPFMATVCSLWLLHSLP